MFENIILVVFNINNGNIKPFNHLFLAGTYLNKSEDLYVIYNIITSRVFFSFTFLTTGKYLINDIIKT